MGKTDLIYQKLPFVLQKVMINVHGYKIKYTRYNKLFNAYLRDYKKVQGESDGNKKMYQRAKLTEFLILATSSSFWKDRFERYSVDPHANDIYLEIEKLPILTKEEVKANIEAIRINSNGIKAYPIQTSGTTGSGLTFYQSMEMINKQWAIWWRYRSWHGINEKTWCGWFGGKVVISADRKKAPFWHVNYPGRQLMFSPLHLSEKTVGLYHDTLSKRQIPWLHGYPSQLTRLALLMEKKKLSAWHGLKVVTIGAENLFTYQKDIIERVLGVPVRQHYGLSEGVANISEDKTGRLKTDDEFCFTEFVKIESDDYLYKVVGTNFSNHVFPLIRYDTGDIATLRLNEKNERIIVAIEGRSEDYLTLPDGGRFGPFNLIMKEFSNISEAQMVQVSKDEILLRVVKGVNYTAKDEQHIYEEVRKRLTCKVDFKVEYIDSIPKTKNGKLKGVVSLID